MELKTIWISLILATGLLLAASQAIPADFRCGAKIIILGDRKYDVLRRCGEPVNAISWEEVRTRRDFGSGLLDPERVFRRVPLLVDELVRIEEWEYNFGPNQFIRYLRFENDRLIKIIEGDYGY